MFFFICQIKTKNSIFSYVLLPIIEKYNFFKKSPIVNGACEKKKKTRNSQKGSCDNIYFFVNLINNTIILYRSSLLSG